MKYPEYIKLYREHADYAHQEMMALNASWSGLDLLGTQTPFPELLSQNFLLKKEIFFFIVQTLLHDGRLRLAKNGIFLTGSIEEQLALFEKNFPTSEEAIDSGIWFFDDECPAGAVWVYQLKDGSEYLEWT